MKFILIRGVSGSGKTHLAEKLLKGKVGQKYAADDYFTDEDGSYEFDPRKLAQAHAQCLTNVLNAFEGAVPLVILHNTCSQKWEYENYVKAAKLAGYEVIIYEIPCESKEGFWGFWGRNSHGVPLENAAVQWLRWEKDKRARLAPEGLGS